MSEKAIILGGILNIGFAVFHILFWKLFNWKTDLKKISRINSAIMQVLNIRLIYVFILFGLVSLYFPGILVSAPLGRFISAAIAIFWIMRASEQFMFFRIRNVFSIILFAVFLLTGFLYTIPFLKY